MSEEPLRLRDDPRQALALRRALQRAAATAPVAYNTQAGLSRFESALAAEGAAGATAVGTGNTALNATAATTANSGSTALATQGALRAPGWSVWAAGIAGVAAVVGISFALLRAPGNSQSGSSTASSQATRAAHAAPDAPPVAMSPMAASIANSTADAGVRVAALSPRRRSVELPASPRPAVATQPSQPLAASPEAHTYAVDLLSRERENRQLEWALAELSRNPSQALAVAEQGHREFANGVLYEERETVAIRALVALRRQTEARLRARRFLTRYPRGTNSDYVRQLVGGT